MKKTVSVVLFLLLLSLCVLPSFAAGATTVLDSADLLDAETEAALAARPEQPAPSVSFFVLTATSAEAPSDESVLASCGIDGKTSAVILCVRKYMDIYYYDIYTFGTADKYFKDSDIDRILDDTRVYDSIKAGQLCEGIGSFLTLANDQCLSAQQAAADKEARRPLRAVLITLAVGGATAGISVLCVVLFYRRKRHGESYPLDRYAKLNLTNSQDVFVGSYVTRVRIQSDSSRSGGGGFSSSSSGGHRGGR